MKSAGAIFPNRSPSNLPFVGRDHPPIPNEPACKKEKKKKKGGRNEEEIVITNQTEGDPRSSHFSCDRVFVSPFFFFSRRILMLYGAFCRFVGHVRNVNYQNATRNDRQIELVGTCWCSMCERKNTTRGRERRRRWQGDESTSENYGSS